MCLRVCVWGHRIGWPFYRGVCVCLWGECRYINGTGGAYILQEDYEAVPLSAPVSFVVQSGPLFTQVCQSFNGPVRSEND